MKLCVTGVPGWCGNRLMEVLRAGGYGDPRAPELPRVSAVALLVLPGSQLPELPRTARVVEGDVRDPGAVAEAIAGADVVLHIAGIVHPGWRSLADLAAVNGQGTANVVERAAAAGARRVVYVSSNSVAGMSTALGRPFRETDPPRPYLGYGRSKAAGERAVLRASARGQIEGVSLRACWFYGPHQADRQTRFFRMIANRDPVLFGAGHNLRSITYVDHLVHAMLQAAQVEAADGRIYWIADERPYETLEIYHAIARALGVEGLRPRRLPSLVSKLCGAADAVLQAAGIYWKEVHVAGEMAEDIACEVDRARSELGYAPWVSLDEGMRRSVRWCLAQGLDLSPAQPTA